MNNNVASKPKSNTANAETKEKYEIILSVNMMLSGHSATAVYIRVLRFTYSLSKLGSRKFTFIYKLPTIGN